MEKIRRSWWSSPPVILKYSVAIASIVCAVALSLALEHHWHSTPFVSLFLCAIMASAWFGGFGPGLVSVAVALPLFAYFFLPPTHSVIVNASEWPRLILFSVAALTVASLAAAQRRTNESLRVARDQLATKVD